MSDIDEFILERAIKIEMESKWDCGEHSESSSQEHIEKCLDKMLASYIGDERNYVVDGAEIECTEMCGTPHCIKYENGKTRLYDIIKDVKGVERDYVPSEKKQGDIYFFGKGFDTSKVRRLHALHAKAATDNGSCFATILDRACLRDVREGVINVDQTINGIGTTCEANIISCGNCGIIRESDIAEIEKRLDESIEYGTCYSLIKPVLEWINSPCTESISGNCDTKIGIPEIGPINSGCVITEHHKVMKFDTRYGPKEGLTMLSSLLCTRGGVITIKVHGQIYLNDGESDINGLSSDDLQQRIDEKINMITSNAVGTRDEMYKLPTIEILARMIFQESHTYKNGEQNAVVYSVINRLFSDDNYTYGQAKTLQNILTAKEQYQSVWEYSAAYHPPQTENDGDYDGWVNAKRLAAIMIVTLEDNVPDFDYNSDIGDVVIIDSGVSKEDILEAIGNQSDSCGKIIDNPIGDRQSFRAVDKTYKAEDGEIIIYTDGNIERGGHVFNYK